LYLWILSLRCLKEQQYTLQHWCDPEVFQLV
jgi:hypothetical protein